MAEPQPKIPVNLQQWEHLVHVQGEDWVASNCVLTPGHQPEVICASIAMTGPLPAVGNG